MVRVSILVLMLQVWGSPVLSQWVNNYDKEARIECTGNQIISFLGSIHSDQHEDRRWQVYCRPSPVPLHGCYWTDFLNDFDATLMISCESNQVLNGIYSYHNNKDEDRRFQVECCSWLDPLRVRDTNCQFTDFINDWDREMTFNVPDGRYIRGVYSVHDNRYEDRRWKVLLCDSQ